MTSPLRFSGSRYAYKKTSVAYLVPFVFAVPMGLVFFIMYLLESRALITGELFSALTPGAWIVVLVLAALGFFVAYDLWCSFRRVLDDEIWVTSTELIWVKGGKVKVRAKFYEVQRFIRHGSRHHDEGWMYTVFTEQGKIRFTRFITGAEDLVQRIDGMAERA